MLQLQNVVKTAFQAVGVLIALAAIHWSVPLVMLTASAVLLLSHGIQIKRYVDVDRSQTAARRRQEYWGKLLTERAPAPEVRLFGLAGHVIASWKSTTERMLREKAALRLRNLSLGVPSSLAAVALFGIVLLALVWAADAGAVTAGAVIGYIYVTRSYIGSISQLQWQARTAGEFGARVRYLPEFLSLEETDRATGAAAPVRIGRGVQFQGVSFTYPGGGSPVLSSIDLDMRAGEPIALVGENGAGKTTLTKLLLGLYEPTAGRICVDGVDLREIDLASWRDRAGAVFQDYMSYAFTARENIGLGRVAVLDDAASIREAAARSGAHPAIEDPPQGYDTLLGRQFEGGHDLSRGQWQALAIAHL